MIFSNPQMASLSIADLGVSIACKDEGIITALRNRFQEFPRESEIHIALEIEIDGETRSSPLMDTGMNFKNGALLFDAPGYQGWIRRLVGEGEGEFRP